MIPSAERIVGDYLRANMDARVVGKTPSDIEDPWLRVTLLDDSSTDGGVTDHLIEALLQIDVYAGRQGNQGTADDLRREARAYLQQINLADHDGAVVTGSRVSSARVPDPSIEGEMERYILTATVWMRAD